MNLEAQSWLAELLGCRPTELRRRSVSGGDINQAEIVESSDGRTLFLKRNSKAKLLIAEAESLERIHRYGVRNYPEVLGCAEFEDQALLALQYYELCPFDSIAAKYAGHALVKQHDITAPRFGWHTDNYIGFTRQQNVWSDCWAHFFAENRLRPQLEMASHRRLSGSVLQKISRVIDNLDNRVDSAAIVPSLLHGDLWTGNVSAVQSSASRELNQAKNSPSALFYDPAPYFGDREVDIAMTMLFGSMPSQFYLAYRETFPEPADFTERRACYNLYHALNHFMMFGPSYEPMVAALADTLL